MQYIPCLRPWIMRLETFLNRSPRSWIMLAYLLPARLRRDQGSRLNLINNLPLPFQTTRRSYDLLTWIIPASSCSWGKISAFPGTVASRKSGIQTWKPFSTSAVLQYHPLRQNLNSGGRMCAQRRLWDSNLSVDVCRTAPNKSK